MALGDGWFVGESRLNQMIRRIIRRLDALFPDDIEGYVKHLQEVRGGEFKHHALEVLREGAQLEQSPMKRGFFTTALTLAQNQCVV